MTKSNLYQAFKDYGIEHFEIELIENFPCNSLSELQNREEYWRAKLRANYNSRKCTQFNSDINEWTTHCNFILGQIPSNYPFKK